MRTRTTDDRQSCVINYSDSSGNADKRTLPNYLGSYRTINDVVVPNFHRRVREGALFFNPYSSWWHIRSLEGGHSTYQLSNSGGTWQYSLDQGAWLWNDPYDSYGTWHLPCGVNQSNGSALAVTQANANVKKPEFESLVSLGELRETLSYLRNPVKGMTDYLRKNRKKVRRHFKREQSFLKGLASRGKKFAYSNELDALASSYLGGRYGLRPLISEAQDLMRAIDSLKDKVPERLTARGYHSETATAENTRNRTIQRQNIVGHTVTDRSHSWRAGVLYSVDTSDTWGTDLSQVPVALWELTFLSFMADWFANIGDYIAALTPKAGIKRHGSWVVHSVESATTTRWEWVSDALPNNDYSVINRISGTESVQSLSKRRTISPSSSLAYRPKGVKFDLGTARLTDMILIARNLIIH